MITKKMTIAEAIKSNPDIIQILSDANIDYCCGGHRPLLEAAEEKNLDVDFSELEKEHEHVGELLKTLSEKTDNYTAPDDIHNHIFLENSVLFLR